MEETNSIPSTVAPQSPLPVQIVKPYRSPTKTKPTTDKMSAIQKREAVKALIGAGVTIPDALMRAGYSHKTPANLKNGSQNPKLRDKIEEGKLLFASKYLDTAASVDFGGDFVANRLRDVAGKTGNERRDFNAVQAIKVHLSYMSPRVQQNAPEVRMQGVFVVPSHALPTNWSPRAIKVITTPPFENPKDAK